MNLPIPHEHLDDCKNYADIFEVVKRAVRKSLGKERAGLMLYLGNLPLNVAAYHQLASNGIVINKRLLNLMARSAESVNEVNSYIFMLLLHEYLHSLGYVDEREVDKLVYDISRDALGDDHPATQMALRPALPRRMFPSDMQPTNGDLDLELIKDFERSNQSYIS